MAIHLKADGTGLLIVGGQPTPESSSWATSVFLFFQGRYLSPRLLKVSSRFSLVPTLHIFPGAELSASPRYITSSFF